MKKSLITWALYSILSVALHAQFPDTLEGNVEMLTTSVYDSAGSQQFFLSLGPNVVPIVTEKLRESVANQVSPQVGRVDHLAGLPDADRKRVEREIGLLSMQALALTRLKLSPKVRKEALESIYKAMQSSYIPTRIIALEYAKLYSASETVEHVLSAVRDPDEGVRHLAMSTLLAIGRREDADALERILQERSQKKSPEEMSKDTSIRYGYEIARKLRSKSAEPAK